MADQRLTDRTATTTLADGDLFHTVDVSDTTDNAAGTSKKTAWSLIKSSIKTYDIDGVRITNATTTGTYNLDHSAGDLWELTLTGNTTLTDSNLPTSTGTTYFVLIVSGSFTLTPPAYWTADPDNDTYDGAKWNRIVVQVINGTTSSEDVRYFLKNLETA